MITILSKTEGFRRCGRTFSKTPVDYPDDAFTPKELAVLAAEPMLEIQGQVESDSLAPKKSSKK